MTRKQRRTLKAVMRDVVDGELESRVRSMVGARRDFTGRMKEQGQSTEASRKAASAEDGSDAVEFVPDGTGAICR